jgi:hypothetical protein
MPTVYLCGPIEGVTKEEAGGWRKAASLFYETKGVKVLDPTRRVPFAERPYSRGVSFDVVYNDLDDIVESDVLLVNLKDRGKGLCWGSVYEIAYASLMFDDWRAYENGSPPSKKIVVVLEEGLNHPFIDYAATVVCRTLEEGLEASMKWL